MNKYDTMTFESVVNNPEHQAEAQARQTQRKTADADQEVFRSRFYQKVDERRKERTSITAARYSTGVIASAVLAYLFHKFDVSWAELLFGAVAVIFLGIACYGWGKYREMSK